MMAQTQGPYSVHYKGRWLYSHRFIVGQNQEVLPLSLSSKFTSFSHKLQYMYLPLFQVSLLQ